MRTRSLEVAGPARFALSPVAAAVALAFTATAAGAGPTINLQDGAGSAAFTTAPARPLPMAAVAPSVTFSPSTLNFGNVVAFSTSPPRTVTLTYTAGYTITDFESDPTCYGGPWSGSVVGGFFSYSSDCTFGTPLPAGSCHFTATFFPFTDFLATSQTLYACAGSFASTGSFALQAVAVPAPPVTFTPSSWDFGTVLLNTPGPTRNFILFNPTPFDIDITPPFVTTDDFLVRDTDCSAVLSAFSRCNTAVQFTPKATGARTAALVVQGANLGSAPGPKVLIDTFYGPTVALADLSGTSVVTADLGAPATIDFGNITVGNPAETIDATLTNEGNGVLTFSSISITAPFTLTNNCPINLNPGDSCTVTVGFDPAVISNPQGTLTIQSNGTEGTHNIPVTANVVVASVPDLRVTPTTVGFGSRMAGTISAPQHITVTNVGGALANLEALSITPEFLISGNTCGTTLPAGASCAADVTFQPLGFGPRRGALTVSGNDADSPHIVTLTGSGCRPFSIVFSSSLGYDPCAP